ncbi:MULTISPECIES: alpha/beta fold hydrolase [unclassified Cryobacterium]|uniref:alpha/beta fold hydrolase n=1 Tax=unclassified Cryobacterium TaxID=2649013 RepID=UPI002AB42864|nr:MULTISPECIES: alpha/beta fold hydrolase [unclassified Cryobacterium]MDY7542680.1 alpha/beta fold hydrolase [Cryobacterium sp. 5B3]MEB0264801.1 alpha/beta fold hydrolase [Cryobacterium sp. 10I5]MEB0273773.1 alpha/beta fold hydrolase [Cryobacterium sp. 5B3]
MEYALAPDGARIAWSSTGPDTGVGAGDPVVLIAGQGVSSRSWSPLLPTLGTRHRVITFDTRGVGDSEPGADERFTMAALAEDVVAVLDAAGIDRAHVYGHSMGGRVAQWFAINHPDRLGALVLGATSGGDHRGLTRTSDVAQLMARGDAMSMGPLFFTDAFIASHPELVAAMFVRPSSVHTRRLLFGASTGHDAWDHLPGITAPTLVLHGDADEVTPPGNGERLADHIPNAAFGELPGLRHGYFLESDWATDAVLRFFAAHPLAA